MKRRASFIALTALLALGFAGVAMAAPGQGGSSPQPAAQSARPAQPADQADAHQHDHGRQDQAAAPVHQPAQTAADLEIDQLVARLNESTGDARIAIMTDLITRLVQERKAAQAGAGQAMCPMCASMGSSGAPMCGMMDKK
jgi:hypothetical protein